MPPLPMVVPSSVPPTSPLSIDQLVILYEITDTEQKRQHMHQVQTIMHL